MKRVTTTSEFLAVKFLGILFDPELNFKLYPRFFTPSFKKCMDEERARKS